MIKSVGRAIWRSALPPKSSVEERKSSWQEGRRNYMMQARKLVRALQKEGVVVTREPTAE